MKLMSDLKKFSLQDKSGIRREEGIDIVEKKARKRNSLLLEAIETNYLVKEKRSLRSYCPATQSGGFYITDMMLLHSTAASNHSGHKIALNCPS